MDNDTKAHLMKWLDSTVHHEDRQTVFEGIMRIVVSDRAVVETKSWPEIRAMAEGVGYI